MLMLSRQAARMRAALLLVCVISAATARAQEDRTHVFLLRIEQTLRGHDTVAVLVGGLGSGARKLGLDSTLAKRLIRTTVERELARAGIPVGAGPDYPYFYVIVNIVAPDSMPGQVFFNTHLSLREFVTDKHSDRRAVLVLWETTGSNVAPRSDVVTWIAEVGVAAGVKVFADAYRAANPPREHQQH
jgi:hypothetical protein